MAMSKTVKTVLIVAGVSLAAFLVYKMTKNGEQKSSADGRVNLANRSRKPSPGTRSYPTVFHHGQWWYQLPNGGEISVERYEKNLTS